MPEPGGLRRWLRPLAALVAALVTWMAIASVADRAMRTAWPAYAAAVPDLDFNLAMQLARLGEGALATLGAAWVQRWIGGPSLVAGAIFALVMLATFVPVHVELWPRFPAWYHLTFLGSLAAIPLLVHAFRAGRPEAR